MKKILAFAGSNSSQSINKQLVVYCSMWVEACSVEVIDLRDYPAPLYSKDLEDEVKAPESIKELSRLFGEYDGFIISVPEYNGSITPVFKNVIDWVSRVERPVFRDKPVMLLAVSKGEGGAKYCFNYVKRMLPAWGGHVVSSFNLPNFSDNFINGKLIEPRLNKKLSGAVELFEQSVVNGAAHSL